MIRDEFLDNNRNIQKCNDLRELFEYWEKEQSEETEESLKKTFPKNGRLYPPDAFKISWTEDGYLGEGRNIKVLFVLKESNGKECNVPNNGDFWMKGAVSSGKTLPRTLRKMVIKLLNCKEESWYENVAYMNLNKRGGFKRCDGDQLKGYVEKYAQYINKEIDIICPERIYFLCGEKLSKEIVKILGLGRCNVYWGKHPSSYRESDEKLVNELINEEHRISC